ncbi:hypothetical protein ACFQX4_17365 [Roseomonas sp. GCM10028921]
MPARGLHATAVALHVAAEVGETDEDLVARLSQQSPRSLLHTALPEVEPRLYRLLDKATVPAWPLDLYRRLDRLLHSRVAPVLLDASEVSGERIEGAEVLLGGDPVIWRARQAYPYTHERQHLSTVVEMLRSLDLLRDLADLPDGAGRKSVYRRVRADLARARAPKVPFPDVPGWIRVETVADLWEIGERLRICVRPSQWGSGAYAVSMITGRSVFLWHRECDALAQVRHVVHDLWTVVQVAAKNNASVSVMICTALNEALRAGGLHLVPSQPADALLTVLRRDDRGGEVDLDAAEDDEAADIAA